MFHQYFQSQEVGRKNGAWRGFSGEIQGVVYLEQILCRVFDIPSEEWH